LASPQRYLGQPRAPRGNREAQHTCSFLTHLRGHLLLCLPLHETGCHWISGIYCHLVENPCTKTGNRREYLTTPFLFQLVDSMMHPAIRFVWPRWVEICTFVSHFLLGTRASINILLFCGSDKRFMVVAQQTLRYWIVCPMTIRGTEDHEIHHSASINALPLSAQQQQHFQHQQQQQERQQDGVAESCAPEEEATVTIAVATTSTPLTSASPIIEGQRENEGSVINGEQRPGSSSSGSFGSGSYPFCLCFGQKQREGEDRESEDPGENHHGEGQALARITLPLEDTASAPQPPEGTTWV